MNNMRSEEEIMEQIAICDIDMAENDYNDIRHVMARAQSRAFRWCLGLTEDP